MGEGSSNSVSEQWSSKRGRQTKGRQTVSVNSGRPTVVVQKGSSNKGSSNKGSSNSGRPKGVVKRGVVKQCQLTVVAQQGSSNKGSSNSVSEQWPPNRGQLVKTDCA